MPTSPVTTFTTFFPAIIGDNGQAQHEQHLLDLQCLDFIKSYQATGAGVDQMRHYSRCVLQLYGWGENTTVDWVLGCVLLGIIVAIFVVIMFVLIGGIVELSSKERGRQEESRKLTAWEEARKLPPFSGMTQEAWLAWRERTAPLHLGGHGDAS